MIDKKFSDDTPLNGMQVWGTHNSCHIAPDEPVLRLLKVFSKEAGTLDYNHLPLSEQLDKYDIRQVELDIYADSEGGLFSKRLGHLLCRKKFNTGIAELEEPGFKVLHIPHIDYNTTVHKFKDALRELQDWSNNSPGHLPIMILLDIKGALPLDTLSRPLRGLIKGVLFLLRLLRIDIRLPQEIRRKELMDLEEEVLEVFDKDALITPDEVRGSFDSLETAVLEKGWPAIKDCRNRFLFCIDNDNEIPGIYLEDNPSLEGRLFFTNSLPGTEASAFCRINDPRGDNKEKINNYVKKGYLMRTRADEDLVKDEARRLDAIESGANFLSTDYPGEDY